MSARRVALFVAIASSTACNLIVGNHDRVLGEIEDGAPTRDAGGGHTDVVDRDSPSTIRDASTDDGAPIVIQVDVAGAWASPNGATFTTVDGGKRITAYDGGVTHPVIVPVTQPSIPSDDYTLDATIIAASTGSPGPAFEFGILTHVPTSGSAIVLSSSYGTQAKAFVGAMSTTNWGPSLGAQDGTGYTYTGGQRYRMKVSVSGNEVRAKMWLASGSEPTDAILWGQPPPLTGRGVGFYIYGVNDAVLEKMTITIP